MTAETAGIFLDCSKNRITDETAKFLIRLAEEGGRWGTLCIRMAANTPSRCYGHHFFSFRQKPLSAFGLSLAALSVPASVGPKYLSFAHRS